MLSVVGALGMAGLGIGFYFATQSEAILLDGLFSLIGFVISSVALWVSRLVHRPHDQYFNFGYAGFEPLLNLIKGFIIAILTVFAGVSAFNALLQGGRPINVGFAAIYAAIAAIGCLSIAAAQRRVAKSTGSPLVEVDAKNWFIDGMLSLAVGVGFVIAFILQGTRFEDYLPYVDPAIVLLMVLATSFIPASIILDNLNQLLLGSPGLETRKKAREVLDGVMKKWPGLETTLRMTMTGRYLYVHVYVIPDEAFEVQGINQLDQIRDEIAGAFQKEIANLTTDIIFTADPRWIGPEEKLET